MTTSNFEILFTMLFFVKKVKVLVPKDKAYKWDGKYYV